MDLKSYYDDLPRGERYKLAHELNMPPAYLSQIASGYVKVPPSRALAIEKATNGKVTRKDLLPSDWCKYWLPSELEHTESQRHGVEQ
ncbi:MULTISPECIES: transcriptional regulator [Enterobacterales]|uniref:transcriptional regulator n=1 Tax=Enterobacterales TaxID=91347 RepID=UPI002ED87918